MKRFLSMLLAAVFLLAAFAGCGGSASSVPASEEQQSLEAASVPEETVQQEPVEEPETVEVAAEQDAVSAEEPAEEPEVPEISVSYPLVTEPVAMTMYASATPQVIEEIGELNNHQGYAMAEEITGVHMDITTVPMDQMRTQLPLLVASGDYPDLFRGVSFSNGDLDAFESEVIIDLTEYLPEYAPYYSALIGSRQDIGQNVCTDEGYHLSFYRIYQENGGFDGISVTQGMLIRQDLLEQLNMEPPADIAGLEDTLTAFKDNFDLSDPMLLQGSITNMGDSLISAFGIGSYFYVKDGEAHYGPQEDAFKEYLTTLNRWYQDGLLNADFYGYSTNPNDEGVISKITTKNGVGVFFDSASNMKARNEQAQVGMEYSGMADLKGPDGDINHFGLDAAIVKGPSYYISTQCDDPALAVAWNDFWYSDEGILITNFGKEGVTFEYGDNGEPQWTDFVTSNPNGLTQGVVRQAYLMYTVQGICINDNEINMLNDPAKEAVALWTESSDRACLMPSTSFTTEESTERAVLLSDIYTYNDEVQMQMVIGELDIESYWDTYIANLKDMGIDRILEITQDSLDRFYAR